MPDLLWDEVKNFFDPDLMGALPDAFVPGASVEDWQALFGLVQTRNWQWQYSEASRSCHYRRPLSCSPARLTLRWRS